MFKIAKILNSGKSVPETVKLPVTASTDYSAGSAVALSGGKAAACTATVKPLYIIAADFKAGDGDYVTAFPVTPDLILEAPVSAAPTSLKVGSTVTLSVSGSEAVGVTATTTDGVAKIYDLCGAAAAGDKMLVRFL